MVFIGRPISILLFSMILFHRKQKKIVKALNKDDNLLEFTLTIVFNYI